ncbi:MAG: hypothetical protein M3384_06830 [Acidobacteriota bacterium]|nr:hypothetical protein [Acidobacteriota bacterium]
MKSERRRSPKLVLLLLPLIVFASGFTAAVKAQNSASVVLAGTELTTVVPTSFYFEGQSAPTQMRNAAAVRFGEKRHVIAGLVDTSGYSTEIAAKYQGFFITDSRIKVGGRELPTGAYGFGFQGETFNIFDVGGNPVMSAAARNDKALSRPRPLTMTKNGNEIRLYAGRVYVVIAAN